MVAGMLEVDRKNSLVLFLVLLTSRVHKLESLQCSRTIDTNAHPFLVCVKEIDEIYFSPPQHSFNLEVVFSQNLVKLFTGQLSQEFCSEVNSATYLCFINLPESHSREPVRMSFDLGESLVVNWVIQQGLPFDEYSTDAGFSANSVGAQVSECSNSLRYYLELCSGECSYTIKVRFENCTEAHWRSNGRSDFEVFRPTGQDYVEEDNISEEPTAPLFYSDISADKEVVFIGKNKSLLLNCFDPNLDYEPENIDELQVFLPASSGIQVMSEHVKLTESKDKNAKLWVENATLCIHRMDISFYGTYVCKYQVKTERDKFSGEGKLRTKPKLRKFLVLPHWCDSERLNWGLDCEFRCACREKWHVAIHYHCDCSQFLEELKSDMLNLQLILFAVLSLILATVFLFFFCWTDPRNPTQSAFRGFLQFISDAWIRTHIKPVDAPSEQLSQNPKTDAYGSNKSNVKRKRELKEEADHVRKPSNKFGVKEFKGRKEAKGIKRATKLPDSPSEGASLLSNANIET